MTPQEREVETFDEQLGRLKWLADGGDDSGSGPGPADREAIRVVLDQRKRLRAALDRINRILRSPHMGKVELMSAIHGTPYTGDAFTPEDYLEAIRPETPVEESE